MSSVVMQVRCVCDGRVVGFTIFLLHLKYMEQRVSPHLLAEEIETITKAADGDNWSDDDLIVKGSRISREVKIFEAINCSVYVGWNVLRHSCQSFVVYVCVCHTHYMHLQVVATYMKDECSLEMVVRIPQAYPLRMVEVECTKRLGRFVWLS
jgi:hypothetical protein